MIQPLPAIRLAADWGLTAHAALHLACLLVVHPELRVSSGRRSVERNRDVGGVPGSWHVSGRAVDLVGPRTALEHARRTADAQRVTEGCTGPEEAILEDDHLHIAW